MTKPLTKKPEKLIIKNIFLADDDEDDVSIFQDMLKEVGPEIKLSIFSDGNELISHLQYLLPDLLFLDLDMPRKNGLECLLSIRKNPASENLPVIVFSSTTRQANIQTAYEMGAHLFLIKSPAFTEYRASIKAVLELGWSDPAAVKEQYCVNGRYTPFV
jgi:DNA-binding response OmpR family regulator